MEKTFSGYCRTIDAARLVLCEEENGEWEVDCNFPNCPFQDTCEIGRQLEELTQLSGV